MLLWRRTLWADEERERSDESCSVKRAMAEADVDIICWAGMIDSILYGILYWLIDSGGVMLFRLIREGWLLQIALMMAYR